MRYRLVQAILVIAISAAIVGTATDHLTWQITVNAVNPENITFSPDVNPIGETVNETINFGVTIGDGYDVSMVKWYLNDTELNADTNVTTSSNYSVTFNEIGTYKVKCEIYLEGQSNPLTSHTWTVYVANELNITDYSPEELTKTVWVYDGETKFMEFSATSNIPCWHVWNITKDGSSIHSESHYVNSSQIIYHFSPGVYNVTLELKKWDMWNGS